MEKYVPLSKTLAGYQRSWLTSDLMAAITVWAIVVPEAMAYAGIAGMPPETGLYVATIPLIIYAVLGTSQRMTVGPSAAVAALSAATVAPFAAAGSEEFVSLSLLLAIVVGAMLVVAGIARMGIIAEFLSGPVLKGFIVGTAMTIALGQAGKLFGFDTEGGGFFAEAWDLIRQLPDTNGTTLVIGAGSLAALFILHRVLPRVPAALVVVVGSILAVSLFDLEAAGVHITGDIAAGLPSFVIPSVGWEAVVALIPGAIGVAIVVYGESMALSKTFGAKHGERVDADQELLALGGANALAGFFGGFVVNGSSSRTAAAETSGQRTQVASLIVGALLVITILFLTPLFRDLPEAALGAIVVHAVWGLIRFDAFVTLWSQNRTDFWAGTATLLGVLVFDVLAGLMIGVVISLLALMARAVRPRTTWLGLDPATSSYRNASYDGIEPVEGVAILRFEAELFFANVEVLRERVITEVEETQPRAVVLDAEAISNIDTTAAAELAKLVEELESRGVSFAYARLNSTTRESLTRCGIELEGRDYGRVAHAVAAVADT